MGSKEADGIFGCENFDSIYFYGTKSDWEKIDIWTIQEGDMDAITVYYDNEAPSME